MKLNINTESFQDSLTEALVKTVFRDKEYADSELAAYVRTNHDRIVDGLESALCGILSRIENPPKQVTKPVLAIKRPDGHEINLWIVDAHQYAILADHRSFHFYAGESASLIYEEKGHGHTATEYNIDNASTWEWIAKWMNKGLAQLDLCPQLED